MKSKIAMLCACLVFSASPLVAASLITRLHVGNEPYSPAINPVTHRLYTANRTDSTVSVVDTTSNTLLATIPVADGANFLAVNPNTNSIYVTAAHSGNTVTVIDGNSNSVLTTIGVGSGVFQVAVDPTINRIYTANEIDDTVSVIDGSTNTVVDTIAMPGVPNWLGADPSVDNLYVVAHDSHYLSSIYVISGVTDTITHTIALSGMYPGAVGVVVDPVTFRAYAPDNNQGILDVIDTTTFDVIATVPGVSSCDAVAVNPNTHNILVPNDNLTDGWNVAAIEDQSLQILGKVHTKNIITGLVVDPVSGHTYLTIDNDVLAVLGP